MTIRMNRTRRCVAAVAAALSLTVSLSASTVIADFEDFHLPGYGSLAAESAWYGQTGEGGFASGSAAFSTYWAYDAEWDMESWEGFACSNVTDVLTADYSNQFAAIAGGGADGSSAYAVGFDGGPSGFSVQAPVASFPQATELAGLYATNTVVAYYSMLLGDMFTDPLGGPGGDEPDWLKLTITGLDASGSDLSAAEFLLADLTGGPDDDVIVSAWTWVDLSSLGAVHGLRFNITGSDIGPWGLNTPAFFAVDRITAVPEPGTLGLLVGGLLVALRRRR